jgi:prepilin-type N-terminal cleavage/methylation domain-containing protein
MKFPMLRTPTDKRKGFTLVELLVVMGIIAILAAASLSIGGTVIKAAKRTQMANTANQIQTAAMAYYTEYSVYPVPTTATASQDFLIADTDAANWKAEIYCLTGGVNPYDASTTAPSGAPANSRAIAFLQLKGSDVDANGGPKNSMAPNTTNIYFNMAFDYDYDNIIGDTGSPAGKIPNFANATTGTDMTLSANCYAAGKGPSGGVAVWANCNGSATLKNPSFWVKTY